MRRSLGVIGLCSLHSFTFQPVDGGPTKAIELKAQGVDIDRTCPWI